MTCEDYQKTKQKKCAFYELLTCICYAILRKMYSSIHLYHNVKRCFMNENSNFLNLSKELPQDYKLSKYNLYLDESQKIVYNLVTQAVAEFNCLELNAKELYELLDAGFIVKSDDDELIRLKKEYESREVLSDCFHLIIAITLNCQFKCFYCYENHAESYMSDDIKEALVSLVERKAAEGRNISIVWYGGEPLLDFDLIEELTYSFKRICDKNNVEYMAAIISNGLLFDDTKISKVDKLSIKSVQITLDGMREVHEKRRPTTASNNAFNQIFANIIKLNKKTNTCVRLRINVDRTNIDSAHELLEYCSDSGLHDIDLTLGMMKTFGCGHMCSSCEKTVFSMEEFSEEFIRFRNHAKSLGFFNAIDKMIPEYKVNACTLDSPDAYVIDPNGDVYKCISQVGHKEDSIGNLKIGFDEMAHKAYDIFELKRCTTCQYFPICKGGCLINNIKTDECNIWKYITERLMIDDLKE